MGPWLGIGAAPATLTLGAAMAARNDGAVPLLTFLAGGLLMVVLLAGQGMLGLRPPHGEGGTLTSVAPSYLDRRSRVLLGVVLALAMVGWNGFNVGLGGASLAALTGVPGPLGAVMLGGLVFATSFATPRLGNRIGVVTTLCALMLVAFCVYRLSPSTSPVSLSFSASAADIAALGGYIAVFAVRAPDFSHGLARRSDLAWCVALLVVPAVCATVAGVGIWLRTGDADVVAVLARTQSVGNLFVTLAVFTPALTTTYSGALALRSVLPRVSTTMGMLAIAVPGTVLAAARFDHHLLPWLALLAALLPPLVVPMAAEAWRRRRGLAARVVPLWTWLPAGAVAVVLGEPMLGLAVSAVTTGISYWAMSLNPREVDLFERSRGRLEAIAYRLLGSATDAEDAVQDTFLRWQAAERAHIKTPEAWLTKALTNVCLNQLNSARARRETYVGQWLPEPVFAGDRMLGPAETAEQRESVSIAVLTLMERLSANERVVYVLREAFGYSHADIAGILDLTESNCQQIYRRAKQHLATDHVRVEVDAAAARKIVEEFLAAALSGDTEPLIRLLTEDAMGVADGGGRVPARSTPTLGAFAVARIMRAAFKPTAAKRIIGVAGIAIHAAVINGSPAALAIAGDRVVGVVILDVTADGIAAIHIQANPDKLERLTRQWAAAERAEPVVGDW